MRFPHCLDMDCIHWRAADSCIAFEGSWYSYVDQDCKASSMLVIVHAVRDAQTWDDHKH